ncbi:MAG: hypothetical protein D6734_09510 [Candidatus Schekmanbacteria bacterium]|nr:MAG: hypothetical protein D6734_09510 [Candidatus Schekmanbacteria bacterium]
MGNIEEFKKFMKLQILFLKIYKFYIRLKCRKRINDTEALQLWIKNGCASLFRRIFGRKS